ncbi:MAG: undecaprenyl-diphosphatase UppP [Bacilli bacterium]
MELINAFILGIVQGIAEFLPISSSAHLIIFRDLFKIGAGMSSELALAFDLALHFGTLLAICIFFFKDFIAMIKLGLTKGVKDKKGKLLWYLIVATIPAAVAGVLFESVIENAVRTNYYLIAFALALMGIIIYIVDKKSKSDSSIEEMSMKQAFLIGCAQVFALIPGFSRSGTTITAARAFHLDREEAAKFSFYLAAPVVLGGFLLTILKDGVIKLVIANLGIFLMGTITSFIIGIICIKYLLKYLKKHDFKVFMWYRLLLAIIVITMCLIK